MNRTTDSRESLRSAFVGAGRRGRLGHAYLFRGPRGVGKRSFALDCVAALECSRSGDSRPCRECDTCLALLAGNHPDLHLVEPEEVGRPISIDRVRQLVEEMSRHAWRTRGRCAILDPAHALTAEASSALLKLIEDPPGETLFLLLSDRPAALLSTIRSRCIDLFFGPLPDEAIERRLRDEADVDPARARSIAEASEGSWHQASRHIDLSDQDRRETTLALLIGADRDPLDAAREIVRQLRQEGEDDRALRDRIDDLLVDFLALLRGRLRSLVGLPAPVGSPLPALSTRTIASLVEITGELRCRLRSSAALPLSIECYAGRIRGILYHSTSSLRI